MDSQEQEIIDLEEYPGYSETQEDYYTNRHGQDNPVYHNSFVDPGHSYGNVASGTMTNMNSNFPQHGFETQNTLLRRKMRTAKEASNGIEEIIMEMPSRTIGRSHGAHIGTMMLGTFSKRSASRYHKRQLTTNHFLDTNNQPRDAIQELYEEIANEQGEIDNDQLRELPVSMVKKKQIRSHADAFRSKKKSKTVGGFQIWKYNMSMNWRHFKEDSRKVFYSARLWQHTLKQVEGHFGSGVLSYFTFLRGLFLLSIPSFILNFAFISLPQLLEPPQRSNPDIAFTGEEILTGANWLNETIMYYGYYINGSIERIPNSEYNMPLAYLLATAGYFLLCLVLLVRRTAASFRINYIDGKRVHNDFISKVFCAWDFGITTKEASELQHKTITTELQEILAERQRAVESRSFTKKAELFLVRLFTWSLYLAFAGGSMALVYFLNRYFLAEIKRNLDDVKVLQQLALALIVSAINLVMPIFFNMLTRLEKYKYPRHGIYIAVFRNFLFKMGLLAVICAFWTDDDLKAGTGNSGFNITCWENELGQEIYRLVVIDFLFSIVFATFCAEFMRNVFAKFCCKELQKAEFAIVNNVMDLIYGQTLCWIGVYFCPFLALIVIIKYFLMFYIKKVSLMQNCRPAHTRWRGGQSQTIFVGLLLISFLLSVIFLGVVVFREVPSTECGPYRNLNRGYDIIVLEFEKLYALPSGEWFAVIMGIIFSVWFLYAVAFVLLVVVVMQRSRALGYKGLANALRSQIALEGKDKQLLLAWLQNLSNHTISPPSGGTGEAKQNKHVVPVLHHHRDSNRSTPRTSRANSLRSSPVHDFNSEMTGDVLTYVDPHHVEASQLAGERIDPYYSPDGVIHRKKAHKDPLLHKALVNQKRPQSMFTEGIPMRNDTAPQRSSYAGDSELELVHVDDGYDRDAGIALTALQLALASKEQITREQATTSMFEGNIYQQSDF